MIGHVATSLEPEPGQACPQQGQIAMAMMNDADVAQVGAMETVIRSYLRPLMAHAEAGTKPPKVEREIDMPDELTEALEADPDLAEAFYDLTPGRQKSYMINLKQAKHSATRVARIERFRAKIFAGKGAMER